MNLRLQCVLVVVALAVSCGSGEEPAIGGTGLADLLPAASSMDGWQIADGPTEYDSEGLFEYLNGGAPLYLDFGFEGHLSTSISGSRGWSMSATSLATTPS